MLKIDETFEDNEFSHRIKEIEKDEKDIPNIDELMTQNINIFQDPEKGPSVDILNQEKEENQIFSHIFEEKKIYN